MDVLGDRAMTRTENKTATRSESQVPSNVIRLRGPSGVGRLIGVMVQRMPFENSRRTLSFFPGTQRAASRALYDDDEVQPTTTPSCCFSEVTDVVLFV